MIINVWCVCSENLKLTLPWWGEQRLGPWQPRTRRHLLAFCKCNKITNSLVKIRVQEFRVSRTQCKVTWWYSRILCPFLYSPSIFCTSRWRPRWQGWKYQDKLLLLSDPRNILLKTGHYYYDINYWNNLVWCTLYNVSIPLCFMSWHSW